MSNTSEFQYKLLLQYFIFKKIDNNGIILRINYFDFQTGKGIFYFNFLKIFSKMNFHCV